MKNLAVAVLLMSAGICHAQTGHATHRPRASHSATRTPAQCQQLNIDAKGDSPLQQVTLPPSSKCSVNNSNGFLLPDPNCTPGATNPTLTLEVLKDPQFTTKCVRDQATPARIRFANWITLYPSNSVAPIRSTTFGRNVDHRT